MTIKQQGGVFGRNPTFNDVEVEGSLSVGGSAIPDPTDIAQLDAAQTFTEPQNITTTTGNQLTVKRSGSAGQISGSHRKTLHGLW